MSSLASKHMDNRGVIAKRLVSLLSSAAVRQADRAARVLITLSSFTQDSSANQVAIAKAGGIPPLITWLGNASEDAQREAAAALLSLATDNATTQVLIAKSNGIPPLIQLVSKGTPEAQESAARALWHLASSAENQVRIGREHRA